MAPEKDKQQAHISDEDSDEQTSEHAQTSKPKRSRRKKAVGAIQSALSRDPNRAGNIPQDIVDIVRDAVNTEGGLPVEDDFTPAAGPSSGGGEVQKPATDEQIRKALETLKIVDLLQGKAGLGGKNKKEMGEYKFWKTQPVPQIGEARPSSDGPIEPSVAREQVRQEPYALPTNFFWSQIDMEDSDQKREVYELLSGNYVEDHDAAFRFKYSAEFLEWALTPPGYHKEWHVGVRGSPKNKLVGFISGVPVRLRVRDNVLDAVEINYLCIHKKLRSKRLAPVLIKEVTRQCHLMGTFQAIYTAGVVLPTPVSVCRYYHRTLNIPKLVDVNFTHIPRNSTLARMIKLNALPPIPTLASKGLREMEEKDLEDVEGLFNRYMSRFKMAPQFSRDEIRHNLLSGRGTGEPGADGVPGRRSHQVVWSYVVEDPESHAITDFFSFYALPSTIMKSPKHSLLEAAYLFYYATDVALHPRPDLTLKTRLGQLIGDLLIVANNAKFDVVNAMTLMDNALHLEPLKFGPGDGYLNFYLYNWRTMPLEGHTLLPVNEGGGQGIGRGIGIVML